MDEQCTPTKGMEIIDWQLAIEMDCAHADGCWINGRASARLDAQLVEIRKQANAIMITGGPSVLQSGAGNAIGEFSPGAAYVVGREAVEGVGIDHSAPL